MEQTSKPVARAVLVGVQLHGVTDDTHHRDLDELERLVTTLGYKVVGRIAQKKRSIDGGLVLGEGRLMELAALTGGTGKVPKKGRGRRRGGAEDEGDEPEDDVDLSVVGEDDDDEWWLPPPARADREAEVVVVNHELTPMQMRNLAAATSAEVLDRTGVIVEIFHRHASSPEAKLQVELARLKYVSPRFAASGGGFDRAGAGIGAKGSGESKIELDRRRVRDRVAEINRQLHELEAKVSVRRKRRQDALRCALVGYTNAGKSSWMRALTGSGVLVEDKLFATLDTTVRALVPETRPRILVSDTVGFIQRLPHDLVASFRSTLDEALEASLLVHVVDGSDPAWPDQERVTRTVLDEIGAQDIPTLMLFNKADKIDAEARVIIDRFRHVGMVVSAHDPADVQRVRAAIVDRLLGAMPEATLVVPYDRQHVIGAIREETNVLDEVFGDEGVSYRVRAAAHVIDRLRARIDPTWRPHDPDDDDA